MKVLFTVIAIVALFSSTLSFDVTSSVDFNTLPVGAIVERDVLYLNEFTQLTTNGKLNIKKSMFTDSSTTIQSSGLGDAVFYFDTSAVSVTGLYLMGASDNAPVIVTTFDFDGLKQNVITTNNTWSLPVMMTNENSMSGFRVSSKESEITGISLTYNKVLPVPLPVGVWLFGIGLIGLWAYNKLKM